MCATRLWPPTGLFRESSQLFTPAIESYLAIITTPPPPLQPPPTTGTKWFGTCWYVHELVRYEFDLTFDIPVTYPTTNPDLVLEELEGKTGPPDLCDVCA